VINGVVVGLVIENQDPDEMNRVKVEYPVDSGEGVQSSWCRLMSPMAGKLRGLVMLPDIGTEVVLAFAYRSMSPYVMGAVYNGGEDKPEPYKNDDENDDKRVVWTRNDHMLIFDDTEGAEKVEFAATAPTRLDIRSGPIWQSLDSAEKTIEEYCDGDTIWESLETISIKCKDFKLEASATIAVEAKDSANFASGASTTIDSASTQTYKAGQVDVNPGSAPPAPPSALPTPPHKHSPTS
jgi:uncharacterized protein involved in type VI secretion and phage assembly